MEDRRVEKIYIIQSCTGTILSNIIKGYTKNIYTHVSLSLDINLNNMYSFGRLNPYNPFWGGFVKKVQSMELLKDFIIRNVQFMN